MLKYLFLLCSLAICAACSMAFAEACYTIIVGREASQDGWVLLAHNEDDGPPQVVVHHKVPRMNHPAGSKIRLIGGGEVDEVETTWATIWSEMPGMLFSDSYVNEWGVAICSDACPSREDQPELTDGGIGYMLRRLVAQRARTAREGVHLAGQLVERFGYTASGRTYAICDPEEGWAFCAVNGKRWIAARVLDDQVAMIANTYAVGQVNLRDTLNFLSSGDIIEYAVSRGWYDYESGPFDFAAAYAEPRVAADSGNFCRQWAGLRYLSDEPIFLQADLPFSLKPGHKLGAGDLMEILRDHYEETELYQADPESGSPHRAGVNSICNANTQTSFVVQLRQDKSADVGIVYWVCLGRPCTSVYVPFHFGITQFPAGYETEKERPSAEYYIEKTEGPQTIDPAETFWIFSNFSCKADDAYTEVITNVRTALGNIEKQTLTSQVSWEEEVLSIYTENRSKALEMLTDYGRRIYLSALDSLRVTQFK